MKTTATKRTIPLILCAALAVAATLALAACAKTETPPPVAPPAVAVDANATPTPTAAPTVTVNIGDIIEFGGYDWRVLDVQDGKALIIADKEIGYGPYHDDWVGVTWATSDMRTYLNGEFYNSFSEADRGQILDTTVINNDNQWYGTDGGEDTTDKIFLLSLEEVVRYFGDSGEFAKGPGERKSGPHTYTDADGIEHTFYQWERQGFVDQFDNARYAGAGENAKYYLRSPGRSPYFVAYVDGDWEPGYVRVSGFAVNAYCGVRPALWLDLQVSTSPIISKPAAAPEPTPTPAAANDSNAWKQLYIDYINDNLDPDFLPDSHTYSLIYINDDEIPELWINHDYGVTAYDYQSICTVSGNRLEEHLWAYYYIERGNLLFSSSGRGYAMSESVSTIQEGRFVYLWHGYHSDDFDDDGNWIPADFQWDGVKMSETEYRRMLNVVFDRSKATIVPMSSGYSYDEIISMIENW